MSLNFQTGLPDCAQLQLPVCQQCQQVNYPVRELCGHCLADALIWQPVDNVGTVQSLTTLHYSLEADYGAHLPWPLGSIKLRAGPVVFAHLAADCAIGDAVTLRPASDRHGNRMLMAVGANTDWAAWLAAINFKESGV